MEDYIAIAVKVHLPPALVLVEIPEAERDPLRPRRFTLALAAPAPR
jgi:hypothetical protein